jgi:hypothetical protein
MRWLVPILAVLSFWLGPARTSAEEVRGVLFGSTLVSEAGDAHWQLVWSTCDQQMDQQALMLCELDAMTPRDSVATCFVAEVEEAPPARSFMRAARGLLVRRILSEQPLIGDNGRRNCRLDGEQRHSGVWSWEFEHSGFYPAAGERWWLDFGSVAPAPFRPTPLRRGNLDILCVDVRGVALPEPEFGAGHMGAYKRVLLVTEILAATSPSASPLTERPNPFAEDHYLICPHEGSVP